MYKQLSTKLSINKLIKGYLSNILNYYTMKIHTHAVCVYIKHKYIKKEF